MSIYLLENVDSVVVIKLSIYKFVQSLIPVKCKHFRLHIHYLPIFHFKAKLIKD